MEDSVSELEDLETPLVDKASSALPVRELLLEDPELVLELTA